MDNLIKFPGKYKGRRVEDITTLLQRHAEERRDLLKEVIVLEKRLNMQVKLLKEVMKTLDMIKHPQHLD